MTSHASVRSAVDAMRHGAIDYIAKPFNHDELLMIIKRSLHQNLIQSQNRALKLNMERLQPIEQQIIGTSLERILKLISHKDPKHNRFLHLHGENGTYKDTLARAMHDASPEHQGPFLVLDVAHKSIDAARLLFGPMGYLQSAQNGTLVIVHPELLDKDVQQAVCDATAGTALLYKNEQQRRSISLNLVRISEYDIEALLSEGRIARNYADLFSDNQHAVPPLRQRTQDIPTLVERQLAWLCTRYARKQLALSDDALCALMAAQWPGNSAQLINTLTQALFCCQGDVIEVSDLGFSSTMHDSASCGEHQDGRDLSLDEYFRYFVIRNQSNMSETELAASLGISRKALWERRQKMNLLRTATQS